MSSEGTKRKRGRPTKAESERNVKPRRDESPDAAAPPPPKRRGRPPKSESTKKSPAKPATSSRGRGRPKLADSAKQPAVKAKPGTSGKGRGRPRIPGGPTDQKEKAAAKSKVDTGPPKKRGRPPKVKAPVANEEDDTDGKEIVDEAEDEAGDEDVAEAENELEQITESDVLDEDGDDGEDEEDE